MTDHDPSAPNDDPRWLDTPQAGRRIHNVLAVICGLLFVADILAANGLLYHPHVHFDFEGVPGFYGAAGFVSYVVLVTAAKGLRRLVKRDPRYYEDPRFSGGGRDE